MRVMVNDVVGTKDGRFGTVTNISNGVATIAEAASVLDPCPDEATYFEVAVSEVASIV